MGPVSWDSAVLLLSVSVPVAAGVLAAGTVAGIAGATCTCAMVTSSSSSSSALEPLDVGVSFSLLN